MILDYLKERYIPGEPIFLADIDVPGMTDENIRYHLKKLTTDGHIRRFDAGVYYFPKTDIFGEEMPMTAETVALHKYILRRGKRVGYYSGYALANRMGLSTQVPFTIEITSNYAPAMVRKVSIKGKDYVIRRPVAEVTEKNVVVLQFLDCLKDAEKCAEESLASCGIILSEYAEKNQIDKNRIDEYIGKYPDRIYKAVYETGVRYVSA